MFAIREQFFKDGIQADLVPQLMKQPGSTQAFAGLKEELRRLADRMLRLQRRFRRQVTRNALHQALQDGAINFIFPAERVDDLGFGVFGDGIPYIVRQLEVGGRGSIFIFTRDATNIHAYILPQITHILQE